MTTQANGLERDDLIKGLVLEVYQQIFSESKEPFKIDLKLIEQYKEYDWSQLIDSLEDLENCFDHL